MSTEQLTESNRSLFQKIKDQPFVRILFSLVIVITITALVKKLILLPIFDSHFAGSEFARTIRISLNILVFVGMSVLCIRYFNLSDKRISHSPLARIIVGVIVLYFFMSVLQELFLKPLTSSFIYDKTFHEVVYRSLMIGILLFSYTFLFRIYENRKITELSGKYLLKEGITGALLGIIIPSITVLILYLNGNYSVTSIENLSALLYPAFALFALALSEELVFRGVIFRITEEKLGTNIAIIISAIIFGIAHLINPQTNILGVVSATFGGIIVCLMYSMKKRLWLPIFFHTSWNFSQFFYGSNVSGHEQFGHYLNGKLTGSELMTGGQFGIENSLILLGMLLILIIVLYWKTIKSGMLIKPYWSSKK